VYVGFHRDGDENLMCPPVYLAYKLHLVRFLVQAALVDADLVSPKSKRLARELLGPLVYSDREIGNCVEFHAINYSFGDLRHDMRWLNNSMPDSATPLRSAYDGRCRSCQSPAGGSRVCLCPTCRMRIWSRSCHPAGSKSYRNVDSSYCVRFFSCEILRRRCCWYSRPL
jgi:hypothetical protein